MARRRRRRGGWLGLLLVAALGWLLRDQLAPGEGVPPSDGTASASGSARAGAIAGRVVRIVDGDTLHVEVPGSITPIEKVRLLRINTPERDQPGYERATAALTALVTGRVVELVFEDPAKPQRDEYGRLLAYVFLDGRSVNVELVRRGWTRFFTKYGEGRFASEFADAEREAEREGAGLWSAAGWNR